MSTKRQHFDDILKYYILRGTETKLLKLLLLMMNGSLRKKMIKIFVLFLILIDVQFN